MLQIPLAELDIAPGEVVEWRLRATAARIPGQADGPWLAASRQADARRASFNQEKHFSTAEESRQEEAPFTSWIATTFEIEGELDRQALEAALLVFVRRHQVLRCEFQRLAGDLTCEAPEADEVSLKTVELGRFTDADELRGYLADRFETGTDTLSWPLVVMGAVVRAGSATVYLAFDHLVCDGMSMPVVVHDVRAAYDALVRDEQPQLPETGCYLDFGHEQRSRYRSVQVDDERLGHWRSFIERNGGFFPRFPLDLGVEQGSMYPTVNQSHQLLDAAGADAMEAACRAVDGRMFMGVLASLGRSLHRLGGPEVYRGLMPVSERTGGPWAHSMGWFVNTAPIEFAVGEDRDLRELLAGVRTSFAETMRHIDVPFVRALELLAPEYYALPYWPFPVNFFSYVDFRRTPGAAGHPVWKPTMHVSASRANGASFWFHRNTTGLYANAIFADTPQANRTMDALREEMTGAVTAMAAGARPVAV